MGYINFAIEKLKSPAKISQARMHNQRIAFCENTDKTRQFLNKQLMPAAPDYNEFIERRIEASPLYQDGKRPRKDAVKVLDMEFRVSAEEMHENPYFDLDTFCAKTREWVIKTFGAENVMDLVLHMDEGYGEHGGELKCAPHIHALVVPMTKDGRLAASEFIGSPQKLSKMQTAVADNYKSMHLKRGMERSVATHVEMKDFYGWVHDARVVDLPEPGEKETAVQYFTRIKPEIQKLQSQHLAESLKLQRSLDEAQTRVKQLELGKNTEAADLEKARAELRRQEAEIKARAKELETEHAALRQWKDVLAGLNAPSVTAQKKTEFLSIAKLALDAGREMRENEERAKYGQTLDEMNPANRKR